MFGPEFRSGLRPTSMLVSWLVLHSHYGPVLNIHSMFICKHLRVQRFVSQTADNEEKDYLSDKILTAPFTSSQTQSYAPSIGVKQVDNSYFNFFTKSIRRSALSSNYSFYTEKINPYIHDNLPPSITESQATGFVATISMISISAPTSL